VKKDKTDNNKGKENRRQRGRIGAMIMRTRERIRKRSRSKLFPMGLDVSDSKVSGYGLWTRFQFSAEAWNCDVFTIKSCVSAPISFALCPYTTLEPLKGF
jgi:hypothetical protein